MDGPGGVLGAVDVGDDDAGRARIQRLLDPHLARLRDTHEARGQAAWTILRTSRPPGAVLHVDEEPVEAGVRGDLGQLGEGRLSRVPTAGRLAEPFAKGAHRWKLWPMNLRPSTIPVRQ
jgi:hypothetical protein